MLMTKSRLIAILAAVLIVSLSLLSQQTSQAHGYIIRSIPDNQAILSRAPSRIQVWFTENLEPKFSEIILTNQKGEAIPLTETGVNPKTPAQLSARIPSNLPNGAYLATVHAAFASDGHVGTDAIIFWVGQQTENIASSGPSQDAVQLEVVWRVLTLIALSTMFGTALLYQIVLLPGWGNPVYRAGRLPPRVMRRLNREMWAAIALALIGTVMALLQQSTVLFATDLGTVLQNHLWSLVLNGTQFGTVLTWRNGLLVLAIGMQAGAVYFSTENPDYVSLLWMLNVIVAGALLATMSAGSHAAGSTLWPLIDVAVDWLHLLANGAWIGGLIALSFVLPAALSPLNSEERRPAIQVVLRRFSVVGVAAVGLLIVTGIYSAVLSVRQPSDATQTRYGLTLIAKIALVLPLLLFGLYHHLITAPGWLHSFAERYRLPERIEGMVSSLHVESALGICVIAIAALLTATPPPIPPEAQQKIEAPSQVVTLGDIQVKLSVDPGAVGANGYEVDLARQSVAGKQVSLQFVYPALDIHTPVLALDDAGDGVYLGAGPDLDRTGDWLALVNIRNDTTSSLPTRAAFRWNVPETAPNSTTRQPSVLNWLSGLGIVVIAGVLFTPGILHAIPSLKLQGESVLIGLMAVVVTAALLVVGSGLLSDAARRTDALQHPVPSVVNPVLPDQASLIVGQRIYAAKCAACHGDTGAGDDPQAGTTPLPDLRTRIADRRDVELFRTLETHNGLNGQLSDNDRWNVINYLRSGIFALPSH
jgi:copper transport protein